MSIQQHQHNKNKERSEGENTLSTNLIVTECLTDSHDDCTGEYIDTVNDHFIILCHCNCHYKKKKEAKKP